MLGAELFIWGLGLGAEISPGSVLSPIVQAKLPTSLVELLKPRAAKVIKTTNP